MKGHTNDIEVGKTLAQCERGAIKQRGGGAKSQARLDDMRARAAKAEVDRAHIKNMW